MKLEMLIDELQEILDNSFKMPLSGGKRVVNTERMQEIVEELRTNTPQEVRQAKIVNAERSSILAKSKQEAEVIVQQAEERAKAMVERSEITRQAQIKANEIIARATEEAEKIKQAANQYIDGMMKKADDELSANLAALKKTRQNLKSYQSKGSANAKNNPPKKQAPKKEIQ